MTFTVVRDGATLDLNVTVGEREFHLRRHHKKRPPLHQRLLGPLLTLGDHFVKAEIVLETDDGYKTFRAVVGTVSQVDVVGGTFVLAPKDGSEAIPYQISDDTVVTTILKGDLGGLNTTEKTLVVDLDGAVKLVQQGERLHNPSRNFRGFKGLPPRFTERFESRGFDLGKFKEDLPSGIRGLFEGLPFASEGKAGGSVGINEPAIQ